MGSGSLVDWFERGDSQGVSLLSICHESRWHEDVLGSSSPVPLEVAEWKWEHFTMDFVTHLPRT